MRMGFSFRRPCLPAARCTVTLTMQARSKHVAKAGGTQRGIDGCRRPADLSLVPMEPMDHR